LFLNGTQAKQAWAGFCLGPVSETN